MRSKLLAIFTALLLTACVFPVGDGIVRATGFIRDMSGVPVSGALVFLDHPSRDQWPTLFETHSKPDGSFDLGTTVAPGHYTVPLVVRAEGYKAARVNVPTLSRNKIQFTLAPASSESGSIARLNSE